MELVDILKPPMFIKTGESKPFQQAYDNEDWVGAFNYYVIFQDIIYAFPTFFSKLLQRLIKL